MNELNILQKYSVKVEGGSGCLFQPLDVEYTYVLTAKHVLNDAPLPSITYPSKEGDNKELTLIGSPFLHPEMDAAIIKVEKVDGIDNLLREASINSSTLEYNLCGFPNVREGGFRRDKLNLSQMREDGYLEATLTTPAVKREVSGQSGGGIIRIDGNTLLLAGIQKGMAAHDDNETLGAIKTVPISCFDEIIEQNGDDLTLLFPPYIESLSNLVNKVFNLDNLSVNKKLIKNSLKGIANSLCQDFSPLKILELYEDDILIHGTEKSMQYHEQLWLSFLELLTINQLHSSSKLSFDQIGEIHKKRKLFFTDSEAWVGKLEDIYKSNLSEIEKDGVIVVAATEDTSPSKVDIPSAVLYDISQVPQEEMNISNTIVDVFKDISIVHIYKFQKHIMDNEQEFLNINGTNVKETLKDKTDGII